MIKRGKGEIERERQEEGERENGREREKECGRESERGRATNNPHPPPYAHTHFQESAPAVCSLGSCRIPARGNK